MKKIKNRISAGQTDHKKLRQFFSPIKVVAFDFDQTLVDETASILKRWKKVLSQEIHVSNKLYPTFKKFFLDSNAKYSMENQLHKTLDKLGIEKSSYDQVLHKRFMETFFDEPLYPGALPLIKFLKKNNVKIGIITNGLKSYQERRIISTGLHDLLDFVHYGDEYQKPDSYWFRHCIKKYNVNDPREFIYIGDDLVTDVVPVREIGGKTCILLEQAKGIEIKSYDHILTTDIMTLYKNYKKHI